MERSSELKNLMIRMYEAITHGDTAFFDRHLSQAEGVLMIGSDAKEWWSGHDNIIRLFGAQMAETGLSIVPGDLQAFCEGSVGWAADQSTFRFPDGTTISMRTTYVFHREGEEWKIVQGHGSVGVSNEETVGKTLTTQ